MTVADVQAAVRAAAAAGGRVAARGFGTWAAPLPPGVRVIDTRGLDAVVDYDPADLTVTAGAGCSVQALQDLLGRHAQRLPVRVARPDATTVGGLIAAGLDRALRGLLIGLEWVGGAGQVLRSGGRVVKNVAGYDLMTLHVGSRGRYGVITTATFKVRPAGFRETIAEDDDAGAGVREAADDAEGRGQPDRVAALRARIRLALDPAGVFAR